MTNIDLARIAILLSKRRLGRLLDFIPDILRWKSKVASFAATKALSSYKKGETLSALAIYKLAIAFSPRDCNLLNDLGQLYYESGDLDNAAKFFRRALDLDFSNRDALKGLAYCANRQGKTDEAIYLYLRYLEQNDNDIDIYVNLIEALDSVAKYEEAIEYGQRAMTKAPQNAMVQLMTARSYYALGDFDNAVACLHHALELEANNSEIHRFLGLVLSARGETEAALSSYRKALEYDPKNGDAQLGIAHLSEITGRIDDYLSAAQAALQAFEATGDRQGAGLAYWDVGWAYYKVRDWEKSIWASENSLKIDSSNACVQFNLGLALLRAGRLQEAKAVYERAAGRSDLGSLQNDGIHDLTKALKEDPDLAGAAEILRMLEDRYTSLASARRHKTPIPETK